MIIDFWIVALWVSLGILGSCLGELIRVNTTDTFVHYQPMMIIVGILAGPLAIVYAIAMAVTPEGNR